MDRIDNHWANESSQKEFRLLSEIAAKKITYMRGKSTEKISLS